MGAPTAGRTTDLKVFIQGVLPSSMSSSWQFLPGF
jgi:hypothetical protein